MRKICVITGTRADYGLLNPTMKAIQNDPELKLQVVTTGMHLSPEFGLTFQQILKDGFQINKYSETLLSSDTGTGICKSTGLGMISLCEALSSLEPDIVLLLGDRFEIFSAASAALFLKIPIAHCHGGETTEGAVDEAIRHSITKMSHLHFTATEDYRRRVIQLGEEPSRVHNTGALGIENINKLTLLSRQEVEHSIGFELGSLSAIVTFHPASLESENTETQFNDLLAAIDEVPGMRYVFTKANADHNGRIINTLIDKYVKSHSERAIVFDSLGQLRYLSLLQYVSMVIGNSSSGLIEVPSFHKPTLNIGNRQKGRTRADSVIDCQADYPSIKKGIKQSLEAIHDGRFRETINPYDGGNASVKIVEILKKTDLTNIIHKHFFDLP